VTRHLEPGHYECPHCEELFPGTEVLEHREVCRLKSLIEKAAGALQKRDMEQKRLNSVANALMDVAVQETTNRTAWAALADELAARLSTVFGDSVRDRAAVRAMVEALPACNQCGVGTWTVTSDGVDRCCDGFAERIGRCGCRDEPWAEPLRALLRRMESWS